MVAAAARRIVRKASLYLRQYLRTYLDIRQEKEERGGRIFVVPRSIMHTTRARSEPHVGRQSYWDTTMYRP